MGPVDVPCGWRPTGPGRLRHAGAMTGSRLGVAALALLAVGRVVVGWGCDVDPPPEAEPRAGSPSASTDLPAAAVLRAWDRRRAEAYAAGSPGQLRGLYVGGAGSSDVPLLEGYRSRGWRVVGMRMQVLAVAVASREPGRLRLRVTDRLGGGGAGRGGGRGGLARDRASTRTVILVRGGDGVWRAAAVRTR